MVVRGEGEGPWIEICDLVDSYLRDQPEFTAAGLMNPELDLFREIKSLSYKTSDGQLHRNPDGAVIADLDSLPWPAYHLFKMDRYTNLQPATDAIPGARSFSIMTSRGCPYRCTFCSQSIMPIKWRARSPENVIEEWRHLVHDLGALEIGVLDDSANIRRNRLIQLSDALIANKLNHVPWIFVNGIRANLADMELLTKLKQAGLKRTAFGVETGDEQMIIKIDKHVDHDTIRQAFKNAKAAGIETIGFFIIGLPGDTREIDAEDHRLRHRARPDDRQLQHDDALSGHHRLRAGQAQRPLPGPGLGGLRLLRPEGALRDGRSDGRADGRDVPQGLPAVLLAAQVRRCAR